MLLSTILKIKYSISYFSFHCDKNQQKQFKERSLFAPFTQGIYCVREGSVLSVAVEAHGGVC